VAFEYAFLLDLAGFKDKPTPWALAASTVGSGRAFRMPGRRRWCNCA